MSRFEINEPFEPVQQESFLVLNVTTDFDWSNAKSRSPHHNTNNGSLTRMLARVYIVGVVEAIVASAYTSCIHHAWLAN